jgi:hypothetical protein
VEDDPKEAQRKAARILWTYRTLKAWEDASQRLEAAWNRLYDTIPDHLTLEERDALNLPEPPEQAELDAIQAQLEAVRERDMWPRELYWSL